MTLNPALYMNMQHTATIEAIPADATDESQRTTVATVKCAGIQPARPDELREYRGFATSAHTYKAYTEAPANWSAIKEKHRLVIGGQDLLIVHVQPWDLPNPLFLELILEDT